MAKIYGKKCKVICFAICSVILLSMMVACKSNENEKAKIADYGHYGEEIALHLATQWPYRIPGSTAEKEAAEYIESQFKALNLETRIQTFDFVNANGENSSSQNVIAIMKGTGFRVEEDEAKEPAGGLETVEPQANQAAGTEVHHQIIIGAHYDVDKAAIVGLEEASGLTVVEQNEDGSEDVLHNVEGVPTFADFNGIHNNAAAIGAMLTVAKEMQQQKPGYDVVFIAFGARTSDLAGSKAYLAQLSETEKENIDCVYNMDGIYAGDKVYAHAGQNSILEGAKKKYEKRRKLYEVTDVYYENTLYTNNKYALYTNQASFLIDGWAENNQVVYREWTTRYSDHTPFDQLDIPIVYFETYNYDGKTLEELKETSNPAMSPTSGVISGTAYDSSVYLDYLFRQGDGKIRPDVFKPNNTELEETNPEEQNVKEETRLVKRINNTAFILVEAARRGPVKMTLID